MKSLLQTLLRLTALAVCAVLPLVAADTPILPKSFAGYSRAADS